MHILIAPNAFKNSLTAAEAAECIERGLRSGKLIFSCSRFPIADGGDGTGGLIVNKLGGEVVSMDVSDPLGRKVKSSFGLIDDGRTAVIEMAEASGIRLLKTEELNPLKASSSGTGELIKGALDRGVATIILTLGGSATVDGGAGILEALGVRFFNTEKKPLDARPESLVDLAEIDISGLDTRILECEFIVLCDVENQLTGRDGAAQVFGPQKGATAKDVLLLDSILSKLADLAESLTGKNMKTVQHGGAAGGTAAGLYAFLNARLDRGAEFFLELTGFAEALAKADLLITGEGSIDEQTLSGKGPFTVASMAKARGIPVVGLAGKVPPIISQEMKGYFDVLLSIGNEPADIHTAMKNTARDLQRISAAIGNLLSVKQ